MEIGRPSRNKKQVNYSDIQDLDDDEDFACVKAPPNKKARMSQNKAERQRTTKPASETASQNEPTSCNVRLSLDNKLYERDLEAALTLSMLKTPEAAEELSPDDKEAKTVSPSLLLSNCSVDVSLMGLDEITGEKEFGSPSGLSRQRQAASKATEQQRRMLQEEKDSTAESRRDEDYQPTCTPESESDADFSGKDESDEEEFTINKVEKKKTKTMEKSARPPAPKKEKKASKSPKSKLQVTATPVSCSPAAVRPISVTKKPASSPPVSRPAVTVSPAGGRLPKWNPPAQIGSPGTLQGVQVKSPGQGLRLGLSRLARIKPLHPGALGH
ncbi:hypothetical protein AAFF_G00096920 [Aldrovandia affinis]|uniref:RAD51 interacting motif domain-containing protein n=1 Tax=Aldrovandia affinis TaxID=143900 RepID=A0AAD7RY13_9TELE|nr:hypothetical protein AAFF_G00096920 [Aldrovandia affinis]